MHLVYSHHTPVLIAAIASLLVAAEPERLPPNVKPISYDLALVPDAEKLTFSGQVRVAIDVASPAESIVLNQDGLTVESATLDASGAASSVRSNEKLQRVTLGFDRPVSAGPHTLMIDYHGPITTGTIGFFAMDYDSPAGKRRTLATNFEPASERRFMPSWDEPALKATFRLTLDIPSDRMAISNMPIESTQPLDGGRSRSLRDQPEDVDVSLLPRDWRFRADIDEVRRH